MTASTSSLNIFVEPTPNPNALKFILDREVTKNGKATFKMSFECQNVPLAQALFDLRGVDQIHFFQNVITVSKFSFEEWQHLEPAIMTTIENMLPTHNPDFKLINPEEERRKNLSPELQQIEAIIDKHIRYALQGDGGDVTCLEYKENVLIIKYQGSCGTCASSTTGTLDAIKRILRQEFNPEIDVFIAPN